MNPPIPVITAMNSKKLKGCYYSRIIMVESALNQDIRSSIEVAPDCCHVVAVCCIRKPSAGKAGRIWWVGWVGATSSAIPKHAKPGYLIIMRKNYAIIIVTFVDNVGISITILRFEFITNFKWRQLCLWLPLLNNLEVILGFVRGYKIKKAAPLFLDQKWDLG